MSGYAAFSPDGRWVAYTSNESGTYEVYVAPFPGPGSSWLISSGGGRRSHWSHDGRQLFYLNGERLFEVEVEVEVEEGLRARQPRLLFELPGAQGDFDVAHDREGFLMIRAVPMESPDEHRIEVALNWAQRLERGGRD